MVVCSGYCFITLFPLQFSVCILTCQCQWNSLNILYWYTRAGASVCQWAYCVHCEHLISTKSSQKMCEIQQIKCCLFKICTQKNARRQAH